MAVSDAGFQRLINRVKRIESINAVPLMKRLGDIIADDNRKGVLAGLDKDGSYMLAVTYRPKGPTVGIGAKSAAKFRNNAKGNRKAGIFGGFGIYPAGLHNNLSKREYEQLTGPPLAPRGRFSRVITNLKTMWIEPPAGGTVWTAVGYWDQVVSVKGKPFLQAHFNGSGHLPVRNLAGLRPEGRALARKAAVNFLRDLIRTQ
jgi:hypothetical protein